MFFDVSEKGFSVSFRRTWNGRLFGIQISRQKKKRSKFKELKLTCLIDRKITNAHTHTHGDREKKIHLKIHHGFFFSLRDF